MKRLTLSLLAAVSLCVCLSACSDDETAATGATTSTGSGAAGGGSSLPEPTEHRATAEMCSGLPPAGKALMDIPGDCTVDSDCTDGQNGRCNWPYGGDNQCMYDECFADADCGGQAVCACRLKNNFGVNRCYLGNCITDADCGPGGWCSPSGIVSTNCDTGISPGSVGFFCHTAEDTCTDDIDCGTELTACMFKVDGLRWECQDLLCTN